MKKFDIIIIGAGISGLLSALALSKHGKKVLIIEKNSQVGGNCNSYTIDGFQVDTGVHAITNLYVGPLKRLMDNYFDYTPYFVEHGPYFVRTEDKFLKTPSNLSDFASFDVLPKKDRLAITKAITKAITLFIMGKDVSKQSVYDFLPKSLSKDSYEFVDTFSYFLSGKSMKKTSAHRILTGSSFIRDSITQKQFEEFISIEKTSQTTSIFQSILPPSIQNHIPSIAENHFQKVQNKLKNSPNLLTLIKRLILNNSSESQGYPRKGLKGLLNSLLYSLPKTVEIKTGLEVKQIITENGVAVGVEADELYYADTILHTGFAKDLPLLIDDISASYKQQLSGIEMAKSLTIWTGLEQPIDYFDYLGSEVWFKEHPYWSMPISNYDSSLAPTGKQLIGFTFIMNENISVKEKIKKSYETIFTIHPEIEKYLEMKHEQITIPEKASVTIDGHFADIRSPIENLYIAGTDTDKRSMGITRASHSVIEFLTILNQDGKLH